MIDFLLQSLKRELTLADIEIFKKFASRLRKLAFYIEEESLSSLRALATIQAASSHEDHPFFPNLRDLSIYSNEDSIENDLSPLHLFIGPSLSDVRFGLSLASPERMSLLTRVIRQKCDIVRVNFYMRTFSHISPTSLPATVTNWRNLKYITISNPSFDMILALSHLPRLTSLEATLPNPLHDTTRNTIRPASSNGGFKTLTNLNLEVPGELESCQYIVRLLKRSPLICLSITSRIHVTSSQLYTTLAFLPRAIKHDCLSRLYIRELTPTNASVPLDEMEGDDPCHLHLLKPFHNMNELEFNIATPFSVGGSTLKMLGKNHPNLRIAYLKSSVRGGHTAPPKLRLQDLLHITPCFPELQRLSMIIDASSVDWSDVERARNRTAHNNMNELMVGCSPIAFERIVASFLSALFPNCRFVYATTRADLAEGSDPWKEKWNQVSELVGFLAEVRDNLGSHPIRDD